MEIIEENIFDEMIQVIPEYISIDEKHYRLSVVELICSTHIGYFVYDGFKDCRGTLINETYKNDTPISEIISDFNKKMEVYKWYPTRSNVLKEFKFREELTSLINRYSKENGSATPDFILAKYLIDCLDTFDNISNMREKYYSGSL